VTVYTAMHIDRHLDTFSSRMTLTFDLLDQK